MRICLITFILFCTALYLTFSTEAWAWGAGHRPSREASLAVLPGEEKEWWGEWLEITVKELTHLPDIAASNKGPSTDPNVLRAQHFDIIINGRQFHYMNGLRTVKDMRAIVVPGITRCLELAVDAIRQDDRAEAAGRLAFLAHVVEDASSLHCMDQLGIFILDEFFAPPDDQPFTSPSQLIVTREQFKVDLGDYRPVLLGRTPQEAAETGFQRFMEIQRHSRHCMPELIQAGYAGDWAAFDATMGKMAAPASRLVADFYHTAFLLGRGIDEPFPLQQSLTTIIPEEAKQYTLLPYRFTPFIKGFNLDPRRNLIPLKLTVKTAEGTTVRTFEDGYGAGAPSTVAYRFPKGLYDKLTATVGLNPELSKEGTGRIEIRLDDKVVYDSGMVGADDPAGEIEIDLQEGGLLVFSFENGPEFKGTARSQHFVLGDPVLFRTAR